MVVDYAHNPSAFAALVEALDCLPAGHRAAVFACFDRDDQSVIEVGRILGDAFDRVVLVDDSGFRDRADGELSCLLKRGMATGRRVSAIDLCADELTAVGAALDGLGEGDLLVIGTEAIEPCLDLVRGRQAGGSL